MRFFPIRSSQFAVRIQLPARLAHTGNEPVERHIAEANTAEAKLSQKRARPAAALAAIVLPYRELRLPLAFLDHCFPSHSFLSLISGSALNE